MKTRIISALVGTVILAAVLACPWMWVFALLVAAAAGLATYELLHNTGIVKSKWMVWGSVVFAVVCASGVSFAIITGVPMVVASFAAYALFALIMFLVHRKCYVWKGFGLTLYAAIGFGALGFLRVTWGALGTLVGTTAVGIMYVLLPLVIAWMSDTGAYFTGVFFGRHKMAPVISPKKTWEGFFGGWVISVGLTVLYGVVCNAIMDAQVFNLIMLAVMAVVLAPLSVVGDLLASMVKRRTGIKDYGNIMPGHGGVMDRFDSVVFIAPMVLAALWTYSMLY